MEGIVCTCVLSIVDLQMKIVSFGKLQRQTRSALVLVALGASIWKRTKNIIKIVFNDILDEF